VHAISGKPLSFIAGIKAGGTGSPRGTLLHLPTELIGMLKEPVMLIIVIFSVLLMAEFYSLK